MINGMTTSNIVPFPGLSKPHPPANEADIVNQIMELRYAHIEGFLDQVIVSLLGTLRDHGYDLTSDDLAINDANFIQQAVRAAMYRKINLPHDLHKVMSKIGFTVGPRQHIINRTTLPPLEKNNLWTHSPVDDFADVNEFDDHGPEVA